MSKANKGFTLIELMVTLAVTAIVLGVAVPSFNTMIINSRSATLGEDFATALNFARSEAVKRKARVTLCASSDGLTCGDVWRDGFMVFVDYAGTDDAVLPVIKDEFDRELILRVWGQQHASVNINVNNDDGELAFVRYTARGLLAGESPVIIDSEVTDCTGQNARRTTVGISGLVAIQRIACL